VTCFLIVDFQNGGEEILLWLTLMKRMIFNGYEEFQFRFLQE